MINENGKLHIKTKIDNSGVDKQVEQLEKKLNDLKSTLELSKTDKSLFSKSEILEMETEVEKLTSKLSKLKEQQFKALVPDANDFYSNDAIDSVWESGRTDLLHAKLNALKQQYNEISKMDPFEGQEETLIKIGSQIDTVTNKLNKLNNKEAEILKNNSKNLETTNKLVKSATKWGLALLSAGTFYSIASKSATAYMSQNEQLSQKMQSAWVAMGSAAAPVLELLANLMLKIASYVNYFVYCLTGVDYYTKALKGATKAQQALNKSTMAFDEMNVAQSNNTSSVSSGNGLNPLPSISDEAKKNISALANSLKNLWGWIKENKDTLELLGGALLALFVGKKFADIMGGIGKMSNGISSKLGKALSAVATVWSIAIVIENTKEIKKNVEQIQKDGEYIESKVQQLNKTTKKLIESTEESSKEFIEQAKAGKLSAEQMHANVTITNDMISGNRAITTSYANEMNLLNALTGSYDDFKKEMLDTITHSQTLINTQHEKYEAGLMNEEQTKDYIETLKEEKKYLEELQEKMATGTSEYEEVGKAIENVTGKLRTLSNTTVNIKINEASKKMFDAAYSSVQKSMNSLNGKTSTMNIKTKIEEPNTESIWAKFKNSINITLSRFSLSEAGQNFKKLFGISFPKLAKGGIATAPTLAMIGEGSSSEAVLPLNDEVMSKLAYMIASAMPQNSTPITNVIKLDGRTLRKETKNIDGKISFQTNGR